MSRKGFWRRSALLCSALLCFIQQEMLPTASAGTSNVKNVTFLNLKICSTESCFSCSRCKQHIISPVKFRAVEFHHDKYRWKTDGKQKYTRWYNIYRKTSNVKEAWEIELDIEAGVDYIRRAITCIPWTWPKGSKLFYLRIQFWR